MSVSSFVIPEPAGLPATADSIGSDMLQGNVFARKFEFSNPISNKLRARKEIRAIITIWGWRIPIQR